MQTKQDSDGYGGWGADWNYGSQEPNWQDYSPNWGGRTYQYEDRSLSKAAVGLVLLLIIGVLAMKAILDLVAWIIGVIIWVVTWLIWLGMVAAAIYLLRYLYREYHRNDTKTRHKNKKEQTEYREPPIQEETPSVDMPRTRMDALKTLGLGAYASDEEIKRAYKSILVNFHPDKLGSAPEGMRKAIEEEIKKVNAAKEMLLEGATTTYR